MDIMDAMEMLKDAGFKIDVENSITQAETVEQEKDNFTDEEFAKACEDLGLEDSGEESDDVDDFFQRLNQV